MVYAIAGLVLANIITVVVAIVFNQQTKLKADALAKEHEEHARTKAAAELAEAIATDEKKRLESVIAYVKTELAKAEAELVTCATPDAVRSRLNNLFPSLSAALPAKSGLPLGEGPDAKAGTFPRP